MQLFLDEIAGALAQAAELEAAGVRVETPRDPELGDFAFPCFQLARSRRKPPATIAAELAARLHGSLEGITVEAAGPYVNFRVERSRLAEEVLAAIRAEGAHFGASREGSGKTILIDFSSPNIAKPMHVGHLRSTIIGAALGRIFTALGYRVVGINHIGDWGSQFGGLVVALRRWRGEVNLEADAVRGLLDLYQRSKAAAKADPEFAAEAREAWRELESGREGEVRELWRWVTETSLKGFQGTYARLGIQHDLVRGESFYEPFLAAAIERCTEAGIAEISAGALIVQLGDVDPALAQTPCLLRQTDGTTLYASRDLAALFQRHEEFAFERALYVVGGEQKLHFRQLKAVLQRLEVPWEPRVEHVEFGLLLGADHKKLASRKAGGVLILDELLDEVVEEAARIVREKNPDLADHRGIAEAVGLGAVVFNDLKRERIRDVLFDRAEILSFQGETGPYVQYTHARLCSILRKAAGSGEGAGEPTWGALASAAPALLALGRYPEVLRAAAASAEPSLVTGYLLGLCRDVSTWYANRENQVLGQEAGVTAARLRLVDAARGVLAHGLGILGVAAPEVM
jgi:arginyl-tRNA synthetase